jgi:hypothetical protein
VNVFCHSAAVDRTERIALALNHISTLAFECVDKEREAIADILTNCPVREITQALTKFIQMLIGGLPIEVTSGFAAFMFGCIVERPASGQMIASCGAILRAFF